MFLYLDKYPCTNIFCNLLHLLLIPKTFPLYVGCPTALKSLHIQCRVNINENRISQIMNVSYVQQPHVFVQCHTSEINSKNLSQIRNTCVYLLVKSRAFSIELTQSLNKMKQLYNS